MNEKIKNILMTAIFLTVAFGFALAFFILPDSDISKAERRHLAKAPDFCMDTIMDGSYFDDAEEYLLDRFPLRDGFRTLKAINEYFVFRKKDNNDIYIKDGYVSKLEYPLEEKLIKGAAEKFDETYSELFKGKKAYYSVIPDKNCFSAAQNGYPSIDYTELVSIMRKSSGFEYIDIFDLLSLEDFYKTDLHWKQENIIPIADRLLSSLGKTIPEREYENNVLSPFYGSFFGQSALPLGAEELIYLTNKTLSECILKNPVTGETGKLYKTESFSGIDPYDVFLSGAQALLIIENPNNTDGGTLYIVRDSFASSITPLLIEAYSQIVLIDARYISPADVKKYIDTSQDADVLFLMSAIILNKSYLYK